MKIITINAITYEKKQNTHFNETKTEINKKKEHTSINVRQKALSITRQRYQTRARSPPQPVFEQAKEYRSQLKKDEKFRP